MVTFISTILAVLAMLSLYMLLCSIVEFFEEWDSEFEFEDGE